MIDWSIDWHWFRFINIYMLVHKNATNYKQRTVQCFQIIKQVWGTIPRRFCAWTHVFSLCKVGIKVKVHFSDVWLRWRWLYHKIRLHGSTEIFGLLVPVIYILIIRCNGRCWCCWQVISQSDTQLWKKERVSLYLRETQSKYRIY